MIAYLWVALGGALGSVARFWVNGLVSEKIGATFPWGTLTINVGGSFVIGVIGALAIPEGRMDSQSRVFATQFLMIGVCGGYTTFSSFSLQTLDLLRSGASLRAAINIVASVVLCVGAVADGHLIAAHFNGGASQVAQVAIEEEG